MYGFYSTIAITLWGTSSVCQEKGQLVKVICGLLRIELTHPKGQIPNPTAH